MQIVIDIPEEDFEIIRHNVEKNNPLSPMSEKDVMTMIANGTPLPKGHGRLIDLNELYELDRHRVEYATTILEADTSGKEQE